MLHLQFSHNTGTQMHYSPVQLVLVQLGDSGLAMGFKFIYSAPGLMSGNLLVNVHPHNVA
jgi:hypothetical protein